MRVSSDKLTAVPWVPRFPSNNLIRWIGHFICQRSISFLCDFILSRWCFQTYRRPMNVSLILRCQLNQLKIKQMKHLKFVGFVIVVVNSISTHLLHFGQDCLIHFQDLKFLFWLFRKIHSSTTKMHARFALEVSKIWGYVLTFDRNVKIFLLYCHKISNTWVIQENEHLVKKLSISRKDLSSLSSMNVFLIILYRECQNMTRNMKMFVISFLRSFEFDELWKCMFKETNRMVTVFFLIKTDRWSKRNFKGRELKKNSRSFNYFLFHLFQALNNEMKLIDFMSIFFLHLLKKSFFFSWRTENELCCCLLCKLKISKWC